MNSSTSEINETIIFALCPLTTRILATPGLSSLLILGCVVGSLATFVNLLFFISVWKVTVFHLNLRMLFAQIAFLSVSNCVSSSVKSCGLLTAIFANDPCSLIVDLASCRMQEIYRTWSSQGLMYACAAVTIERLYSTMRHKATYHWFPWLGIVLIPLCYVIPITNTFKSRPPSGYTAICENVLSSTIDSAKTGLSTNLTFTLISLILVSVLHYWNSSQLSHMLANRATTHTLAARFQLDQNVQLTKIIAPSAVLELLTFMPSYILLLLIVIQVEMTYETRIILIQCNYFWKLCFCLAYPVLAFARNGHLKRGLIKVMPGFVKKAIGGCHQGASWKNGMIQNAAVAPLGMIKNVSSKVAHFELLDQAWAKAKK